MKGAPWSEVRRAAALYEQLGLSDDEALSILAARLLQTSREHALAWLEVQGTQPPERRDSFLVLALDTGSANCDPVGLPHSLLTDLAGAPAAMYECWAHRVLDGFRRGVNPLYLAAGVRLATQFDLEQTFPRVHDAPDFDPSTGERLERLLPSDWAGRELMDLWETCGFVPGFASYIRRTDWGSLTREQRRYLLRFFMEMRWDQDGPIEARRWRAIAALLPDLERRWRTVPHAFTDQYLNDVGEHLPRLKTVAQIRDRLPLLIELLARVNQPPFDPDGNATPSLGHLLELPEPDRRRVLAAPEAAFLTLDRACRRSNTATLIAWGLSGLVAGLPQLVGEAFSSATASLIRTAQKLGVLSPAVRAQLVRCCGQLPVFEQRLDGQALAEIVSVVDAAGAPEAAARVPRAVRGHLAGRRTLSPLQLARHLGALRAALPSCRLAVVRAAVDAELARSVGSGHANRDALSALALLQKAEGNRRGLRRFLRAHLSGDPDHLLRHPATRDWVRRHARIDIALWTRGFELRVPDTHGREVVIRLEEDPLEVLRMGTYVGSCLGLGGGFSYSAAAALLDVNKQVLYARDDRGTVIGRQLVAISDDDQLVPFSVYPLSAPGWLQLAFDRYDSELARGLGIPRVEPLAEYEVEGVLSHGWWDDGSWDPGVLRQRPGSVRHSGRRVPGP